jgi:spermidine synthase
MATLIEQLLSAQQNGATLLATAKSAAKDSDNSIEVYQHHHRRWIYTGGQSIQSTLDLDAPDHLVQIYQQVMLTSLLCLKELFIEERRLETPRRILNLGFGGGAFERFFVSKCEANNELVEMVGVDANAQLVKLAQQYMQIPAKWPVVIDSAEHYLAMGESQFDLILCDLFVGQNHAPCLSRSDGEGNDSFYSNAAKRLTDTGVMAINLAPESEAQLLTILHHARQVFCGAMISGVSGQSNLVLVLSKQPMPDIEQLMLKTIACQQQWSLDFAGMLSGFKQFPNKT